MSRILNRPACLALSAAIAVSQLAGCASRRCGPMETVPASCVQNASCCTDFGAEKINFLKLRRAAPDAYVLGPGDTLGVYIQGITGDNETPPPVHFPEDETMQPALGYPVPIRDDGYISLPLINPIKLTGYTLAQAEVRIRDAYTSDREILLKGNEKIIVTLMKRRTYNVLVIREDSADTRTFTYRKSDLYVDDEKQGRTFSINLPAYENDVLHALSETGGMPGEGAVNELVILRGGMNEFVGDGPIIHTVDDGNNFVVPQSNSGMSQANLLRIPIESDGGFPDLSEADVTLNDGDVLYIQGRQRDVFYTGGLLEGGRFPLPRDYDIDVLEAISMAGGNSSATAGGSGGNGIRLGNIFPATRILISRKENCERKTIEVDLRCALTDPSQRVIIKPGDLIVLEYRKGELAANSLTSILQFGGIFRLFN
ncbi:MAG: polysaccharide biosynthesis/export family protein [Planctomycetota bacterium]